MAVIYTISHPFTNEVVYVGCSNSLAPRARAHINCKSTSEISKWIQALKEQFMLPKIEVIESCDQDESMYLEGYWIQQFQSWGFTLLNKYKTIGYNIYYGIPKKVNIIKRPARRGVERGAYRKRKTAEQWAAERQVRREEKDRQKQIKAANKTKKWTLDSFEVGKTYEVPLSRKNSFRELLRASAKSLALKRHFPFIKNGDNVIFTINDGHRIYLPHYGETKSGKIRYWPLKPKPEKKIYPPKEPKFKYGFDKAKIGDTINISVLKFDSFKICLKQYNELHGLNICISYELSENQKEIVITYAEPGKEIKKGIPQRLTRPNGKGYIPKDPALCKKSGKPPLVPQEMEQVLYERFKGGEKIRDILKDHPEYKNYTAIYYAIKRYKLRIKRIA